MDGELLSLKWNNHRTTFYHVISGLRNKETYTDVTLACEGKFYPVHKLVLSTCSEYFSDIFERTPCKNPVVVLKDIQCRDIEFLLDYMYIGEVNVRQNELSSLIKAAECLRIKGLAVPDEEPKKASSNSVSTSGVQQSARQRPEQPSPPAKRRKADDRRATSLGTEHSPGRPPGDPTPASPDRQSHPQHQHSSTADLGSAREQPEQQQGGDVSTDIPTVQIKVEQDNFETTGQDDYTSVQSNSYDDGGGDDGEGPQGSEGNTNEFPEFLQSTVEKEEPVAMSDFNPSDFPGPSGLQNSGLATWESENSSTNFAEGLSGAVAAAVAAASQPQRQQQQLWVWPSSQSDGVAGDERALQGDAMACESPAAVGGGTIGPGGGKVVSARGAPSTHLLCHLCGYVAQRRQHLETHVRTHTGERPHQCPHCKYKCSDLSNLKKHIRIHTGEKKPFACPHCPFRSGENSSLKKHTRIYHTPDNSVQPQDAFAMATQPTYPWQDSAM
ncbi:protein tramtrack, beta isoform-like isoform X2 [Penaeus chinensis]|uniref:protein tramtrack, beta isoform-like isoform X2 n=1 Tax=Penaeus chinensis TaxID=139456 RepID=UPI001FB80AFB|nr:protein tramtrack, beta isoform-like isoform X2 [Penaeus chinensis]XP_047482815.1 protein tramtrack, beta isoform-like isoform X2 [Penaeus chinensis]